MFTRTSLTHLAPAVVAVLLGLGSTAVAQSPRAHLSEDLQRHVAAGGTSDSRVVITGSQAAVDAHASRHGLQITRRLSSGAVLTVPAGKLAAASKGKSTPQAHHRTLMRAGGGLGAVHVARAGCGLQPTFTPLR